MAKRAEDAANGSSFDLILCAGEEQSRAPAAAACTHACITMRSPDSPVRDTLVLVGLLAAALAGRLFGKVPGIDTRLEASLPDCSPLALVALLDGKLLGKVPGRDMRLLEAVMAEL